MVQYGAIPPKKMPEQNMERLLLLLERWQRGAAAMQKWADKAKECVDFVEGRQWDAASLARMAGRPALTVNKTNRLVRLMMGYFANNRTDITYMPGHDGTGQDDTAEAITKLGKQLATANMMQFRDLEVFMDGVITGRGFFDQRMCFEDNDFGDGKYRAIDPFALTIDPDCNSYDLNESAGFLCESRMASLDEIEVFYGKDARQHVEPFAYGATPVGQFMPSMTTNGELTTPIRNFGMTEDNQSEWWDNIYNRLGAFYDPLRKSLRIMDFQHKVLTTAKVFIDLETGQRKEIPQDWSKDRINRVLYWCQQNNAPIIVDTRPIRKMRWTTIIADMMVYDDWSPYPTYTITGYFPYFRRGVTRGMVEDLIDPNKEVNKRRSSRIDAVTRMPHSGWQHHESSLSAKEKNKLKHHGGEAGYIMEWKGDPSMRPTKIEASATPTALSDLEREASDDLLEVSGINESALGQVDIGQSGKAIEARQRQSVIAVQLYMTNWSRSKTLFGVKQLEIVQDHYTEARTFRILGENGKPEQVAINQAVAGNIINNVSLGNYDVDVAERPLSATMEAAQFDETMELIGKFGPLGQVMMQQRPDLIIDQSSIPRKQEWIQAIAQAVASMGQQSPQPGAPSPGAVPGPGAGPGGPPSGPAVGGNVVALRQ